VSEFAFSTRDREFRAQKQIRILHVLGTMNPGGVETWLMHVLRNIDRSQFQMDFCVFGSEPGLYATEVERLGGTVWRCRMSGNLWSFSRRFQHILRQGKYDIVHSHVHFFSGNVLRWAKAQSIPIRIAHSHSTHDGRSDVPMRRYYRTLMKSWVDRYATHGLAASRSSAAALFGENWERDDRFCILHCAVDLHPFQEPVDRETVRRGLGLPKDVPTVGHVGRFSREKNHLFLLEIVVEVLKRRPEIHFLLVGDGPLRPATESRVRSIGLSGKVHFAGIRTDVARLMRGAMDVFIFPSLWEGLPMALIEAQAAGLRCVVSDGCTTEVSILPDQFTQISLSKPSDVWAANVIKTLERGKIGGELPVQIIAQTDFSIQQSVRTLSDLYETADRDRLHAA
jgi:glycosyltransferase involved in cell wall biosynthesis